MRPNAPAAAAEIAANVIAISDDLELALSREPSGIGPDRDR
jgi:hypothetical protein